eukprot:gene7905-12373_t
MQAKKSSSLFVRNLPYSATEIDLKEFVKEVGMTPKKCVIVKDEKGESKGYGFIHFNLSIDAETAEKRLNQQEFQGRRLRIELSKDDFKFEKKVERKNTIMIRGLTFKKNLVDAQKSLEQYFKTFGIIRNIRIPASKDDRDRHQGYAFIEYQKEKSASLAVEKSNGHELDGHALIVDFKINREEYLKQKTMMINQLHEKQKIEKEEELKKEKIEKQKKEKKKEEFELSDTDDDVYSSDDDEEDVEMMKKLVGDLETESEDDSEEEEEVDEEEEKQKEKLDQVVEKKRTKNLDVDVDDDFDDENEENEMFEEDQVQESEEEESESSEEESESSEEEKEEKKNPQERKKEDLSKTIFIKNLPFDATTDQISKLFSKFGAVQYVAIVKNKQTKQPSGTAFLKYQFKHSLDKLFEKLEESQRLLNLESLKKGNKKKFKKDPVLDQISLSGRPLTVLRAIEKDAAVQKKEEKEDVKDKRNLHLLKVGYVHPKSDEAALLPDAHIKKIQANYLMKKDKLKDPNNSISKTRLCIFNLHRDITEADLKALFKEMSPKSSVIKQVKIVKEKDTGKSKGFGFIEFSKHENALIALQKINNNVKLKNLLLLVEFAVENAVAVQKLKSIMERGKVTSQQTQKSSGIVNFNKFQKRKRVEGNESNSFGFGKNKQKKRKY